MTRIYIAGPMTGLPDFNYPAFNARATDLADSGHVVLNPTTLNDGTNKTWNQYLRESLTMMLSAEAVSVLPGWEQSKGATLEIQVALVIGIPVIGVDPAELSQLPSHVTVQDQLASVFG